MKTSSLFKKVLTYCVIIGIAFVCALNYNLFVLPNRYAPSGVNGLCTILYSATGFPVAFSSLLVNIPLALLVYFMVSKPLATRSMVYVLAYSTFLLILEHIDLSAFAYSTENSAILGPLIAGIIFGTGYSMLIKASAYTGGTDFIAAIIHKKHPNQNIFSLIFCINIMVAVASFFVYDHQLEPVLLCILYSFASSTVSDRLTKISRSAIRFEIITQHPQEISDAIIHQFHHSATLIPGKGMYHGKETNVLICIVNKTQVASICSMLQQYPETFAVFSQVGAVMGNFKRITESGQTETSLLDPGDNKAI